MNETITIQSICPYCDRPSEARVPADFNSWPSDLRMVFERIIKRGIAHDGCDARSTAAHVGHRLDSMLDMKQRDWEQICPAEFRKPIDWSNRNANRENYEKLKCWRGPKGLSIVGNSGMCKTRFVYSVLAAHFVDGKSLVAMSHADFRHTISWAAMNDSKKLANLVDMIRKADIWFLDDLGNGRFTPAAEEGFELILNDRTQNNKPCIFTLCGSLDQVIQQISEGRRTSIRRRIVEYTDLIEFTTYAQTKKDGTIATVTAGTELTARV